MTDYMDVQLLLQKLSIQLSSRLRPEQYQKIYDKLSETNEMQNRWWANED